MNPKKINSIREKPFFSIIIPVYNRPEEIDELLHSLTGQTYKNFEVIIVEDGSEDKADKIVDKYRQKLEIQYFYKENSGPGQSRNYGMQKAKGNYFIILDSDVIVPTAYVKTVADYLKQNYVDAFGGPDAAHKNFTSLQKAIDFAMTSVFTTGGIRGKAEKFEKFHPRSFNMGISKQVFKKTGGFSKMRFGEDIDLSIRIKKNGFTTSLIKKAFVYHKRRNNLKQFFKQIYNSGIARINLYKKHPESLKIVHFFPLIFALGFILSLVLTGLELPYLLFLYFIYFVLIFFVATIKYHSLKTGFLSVITSFVMLWAYALGFTEGIWKRLLLNQNEFNKFENNFYD